jgi:predicted outer membrane repeat protein
MRSGADTITFSTSVNTITLFSSPLTVTDTLTINGPGSESLEIVNQITTASALFQNDEALLTLKNFTLRQATGTTATPLLTDGDTGTTVIENMIFLGNNAALADPQFALILGGKLTLQNTELNGSSALNETSAAIDLLDAELTLSGSAILGFRAESGAAILSVNSEITLLDSTLSGNRASKFGGAISSLSDTITLSRTLISNNSAEEGGGISANASTISLDTTLVTGNTAATFGGGIWGIKTNLSLSNSTLSANTANFGGAVFLEESAIAPSTLNAVNSTVSGNRAGQSGGAFYIADFVDLNISSSTIADNVANSGGGGLFVANIGNNTFVNSVIARNSAPLGPNIFGNASLSFSFLSNNAEASITELTNQNMIGTATTPLDPGLGALSNNGGIQIGNAGNRPLTTYQLLPTSPLIDAGDNAASFAIMALPSSDQRGAGFDRIQGAAIDIGSIETSENVPNNSTDPDDHPTDDEGDANNDDNGNDNDPSTEPPSGNADNDNDDTLNSENNNAGGSGYPNLLLFLALLFLRRRPD